MVNANEVQKPEILSVNVWSIIIGYLPKIEQLKSRLISKSVAGGGKINIKLVIIALENTQKENNNQISAIEDSVEHKSITKELKEATEKLQRIRIQEWMELRKHTAMPKQIKECLIVFLLILRSSQSETGDEDIKAFLREPKEIIQGMLPSPKQLLTPSQFAALRRLVNQPQFTVEHMMKMSSLAALVTRWIIAYYHWIQVKFSIIPIISRTTAIQNRLKYLYNISF